MRNAAELAVTPDHDKYDDDHDQYDDCDDDGEVDIGDVWVNLVLEWHIWYLELGHQSTRLPSLIASSTR